MQKSQEDRQVPVHSYAALVRRIRLGSGLVLFTYLVREQAGFRFVLEELEMERTGDTDKDIQVNTARWTALLETAVRKWPEQWFWVHRRWKTRKEAGS